MGSFNEVEGDLIKMALHGWFDVITHGCNCQSKMGSGIAVPMAETFGCDKFPMETKGPNVNKLGNVDFVPLNLSKLRIKKKLPAVPTIREDQILMVVNSYTQVYYGSYRSGGVDHPFDYEAFTICMRKINALFSGLKVGMPRIGAGKARGDWDRILKIIKKELTDCHVTVVTLP